MSICKDCGKDLIGHPTACEPTYLRVVHKGKGTPKPFPLELCESCVDLESQLATAQARVKELEEELDDICVSFGIGEKARSHGVIMTNVKNAIRRSSCLGRIEQHLTATVVDDGEEYEESLLNWGQDPDEYIETFKEALRMKELGIGPEDLNQEPPVFGGGQ